MSRPESEFPTIRDLRDGLTKLVEQGIGDLPVQIVIVPGSTMEAVARIVGGKDYDATKRALMIELEPADGVARFPVSLVSTDYIAGLRETH